jgi:hypothetical protein
MNRKDELIKLVGEDSLQLVTEVIDEVIFLEGKLKELKKYPFIQVHPKDDAVQRVTPASKQYKEFLQQYINCIKMIEYVIYKDKKLDDNELEESPLRKWFEENANQRKKDMDSR